MVKLRVGAMVRTSYGTGPYRVEEIERGCTCPRYLDWISMRSPPRSAPHIHLTCSGGGSKGPSYLNGYRRVADDTYRSVWGEDELFVIEQGVRPALARALQRRAMRRAQT